ncbi:MAG: hypothetical protein P8X63_12310, partial [Desulfuromonadaceae bacterium]
LQRNSRMTQGYQLLQKEVSKRDELPRSRAGVTKASAIFGALPFATAAPHASGNAFCFLFDV